MRYKTNYSDGHKKSGTFNYATLEHLYAMSYNIALSDKKRRSLLIVKIKNSFIEVLR